MLDTPLTTLPYDFVALKQYFPWLSCKVEMLKKFKNCENYCLSSQ